jgi:hypothetical protein
LEWPAVALCGSRSMKRDLAMKAGDLLLGGRAGENRAAQCLEIGTRLVQLLVQLSERGDVPALKCSEISAGLGQRGT